MRHNENPQKIQRGRCSRKRRRRHGNMSGAKVFPVFASEDCPLNTVYFLTNGSTYINSSTGEVMKLLPGYYINPRRLGSITNIQENPLSTSASREQTVGNSDSGSSHR